MGVPQQTKSVCCWKAARPSWSLLPEGSTLWVIDLSIANGRRNRNPAGLSRVAEWDAHVG